MRLSLLSKYRKELFGACILGVLAGHALPNMSAVQSTFLFCFIKIFSLIGVRGFIFLSGFGLYYSLKIAENVRGGVKTSIWAFYKKRLMRVYVPYCCIGTPYFFWKFIVMESDIEKFIAFIFPVSFWIYGNIAGMWYIDVILVFYLAFPFLYDYLETKNSKLGTALFMALGVMINVFLYCLNRPFYELIAIGISKIPLLIFGVYIGKCAYEEKRIKWGDLFLVSIIWFGSYIFVPKDYMGYTWLCDVRSVLGCLYLTIILDLLRKKYINDILGFFGAITLELYLLHLFIGDVLSIYHVWENDIIRYCVTIMFSIIAACLFSDVYRKILRK